MELNKSVEEIRVIAKSEYEKNDILDRDIVNKQNEIKKLNIELKKKFNKKNIKETFEKVESLKQQIKECEYLKEVYSSDGISILIKDKSFIKKIIDFNTLKSSIKRNAYVNTDRINLEYNTKLRELKEEHDKKIDAYQKELDSCFWSTKELEEILKMFLIEFNKEYDLKARSQFFTDDLFEKLNDIKYKRLEREVEEEEKKRSHLKSYDFLGNLIKK